MPLRRCRPDPDAELAIGRRRDLVPLRCRSPRVPVDRCPRPCRRARGRSALRRHGRAGRSRDVLLSRRTPLAQLLSLDPGPQHDRGGRPGPVNVGRPLPLDPSRSEQPDRVGDRCRSGRSRTGPPSTTATASSPRPCATADRCGWRAGLRRIEIVDCLETTGRTRLPAGIPPWAPTSRPGWSKARSSSPGRDGTSTRSATLSLPDGLSWSLYERWDRPGPRLVFLALRREAAGLGGHWRGRVQSGPAATPCDRAPVPFGWRACLNR